MVGVLGFSFSGSGQNAGLAFVTLKDWDERKGAEHSAQAHRRARVRRAVAASAMRSSSPLSPPPIPRTGHRDRLRLPPAGPRRQRPRGAARGAQPAARHGGARARCWPACGRTAWKTRRSCSSTSTATRPARSACRSTRSTRRCRPRSARPTSTTSRTRAACSAWSCRPMRRRACSRKTCCSSTCCNSAGQAWCRCRRSPRTRWITGPMQTVRYNGYPAMRISGDAGAGLQHRRGDGRDGSGWRRQLPAGFGFEWTGQSREEKLSGSPGADPARRSRCWRCSCAWRRCTRAGRSRSR